MPFTGFSHKSAKDTDKRNKHTKTIITGRGEGVGCAATIIIIIISIGGEK